MTILHFDVLQGTGILPVQCWRADPVCKGEETVGVFWRFQKEKEHKTGCSFLRMQTCLNGLCLVGKRRCSERADDTSSFGSVAWFLPTSVTHTAILKSSLEFGVNAQSSSL